MGDAISEKNPGRFSQKFHKRCGEKSPYIELDVPTSRGMITAYHGDMICRSGDGLFEVIDER